MSPGLSMGVDVERVAYLGALMLEFCRSKSMDATERVLQQELDALLQSDQLAQRNQFCSRLEQLPDIPPTTSIDDPLQPSAEESAATEYAISSSRSVDALKVAVNRPLLTYMPMDHHEAARVAHRRTHCPVVEVRPPRRNSSPSLAAIQPGVIGASRPMRATCPQEHVVFHKGIPIRPEEASAPLSRIDVPWLALPHVVGMEDKQVISLPKGALIGGRYRVNKRIGSGCLGRVYHCSDLSEARDCAVKVINNDKDSFDRGLAEIRTLLLLQARDGESDTRILRLLDYFYYREHLFIVTELLEQSLHALLRPHRRGDRSAGLSFTPSCVRTILTDLLKALAFCHANGVAHCDVKYAPDPVPASLLDCCSRHAGLRLRLISSHHSFPQRRGLPVLEPATLQSLPI